VALDLEGDAAVRDAFERVIAPFADAQGAFVQEFIPGGHEAIVGVTRDPAFGPLIAFGVGGVHAELIGDAALGMHTLTDRDAAEMIGQLRSAAALDGYRGAPAADKLAIKELLLRVSALVGALPQIAELDLNPVKVLEPGRGARIVDCRIRVTAH
jgi:acyl-CoA synthetase (NDP forming)